MTIADHINGLVRRVPVWPVYLAGLASIPVLFVMAALGRLGVEPIEALEHRYGLLALQVMLVGLAISPLRRYAGINLIRFRRAIGLIAFALVSAHLAVWLLLDVQVLSEIWADIVKRPYITIGMAGLLCLAPLAVTSNDWSVRRLGPYWRRLHLLTYPAILFAAAHFVMLRKGWQIEPLVYLAIAVALLTLRVRPATRRSAVRAG